VQDVILQRESFFFSYKQIFKIMGSIKVRGKMQRVAVINQNRVLGRAVRYSTVKGDEVVSYAANSSHVPESTLRACTLAMREAIAYFVLNGHHVNLGKFGILGVRSKQSAASDAEQVNSGLVKKMTIGFTPSVEIKEAIASLRIETEV
jgi:nucleoid DNA-binding protein